GLELRHGDPAEPELQPERRVGADAAADLERVVAEPRQRQLREPAVVALGAAERLEDAKLQAVVAQLARAASSESCTGRWRSRPLTCSARRVSIWGAASSRPSRPSRERASIRTPRAVESTNATSAMSTTMRRGSSARASSRPARTSSAL